MPKPIIVSSEARLVVRDFAQDQPPAESLYAIDILDGRIKVDMRKTHLGERATLYALFASTGLSNNQIADVTGRSSHTVSAVMHNSLVTAGWKGRANIASWMFDTGVYTVEQPVSTLTLSDREMEVVDLLADGNKNKDIGIKLDISSNTVKSHLDHITEKVGLSGREALSLAALASVEPEYVPELTAYDRRANSQPW